MCKSGRSISEEVTSDGGAVTNGCEVVCPGGALLAKVEGQVSGRIPAVISTVQQPVLIFLHDYPVLS